MSWDVLPWVYPVWDPLSFLDLGGYFLPYFMEVLNYYLLMYFLMPFLFVFFWDSYDLNVGAFNPFTFKLIIDIYDAIEFTLLFGVRVYAPFLCFLSREDPLAFDKEPVWWW